MLLKPGTEHGADKVEPHASIVIFEAERLADVKAAVEKDIYYTSGVLSLSVMPTLRVWNNELLRFSGIERKSSSRLLNYPLWSR